MEVIFKSTCTKNTKKLNHEKHETRKHEKNRNVEKNQKFLNLTKIHEKTRKTTKNHEKPRKNTKKHEKTRKFHLKNSCYTKIFKKIFVTRKDDHQEDNTKIIFVSSSWTRKCRVSVRLDSL